MTTAALKKEIKKAIENIEDSRVLEAVYVLLNKNTQNDQYQLSDEDIAMIEEREAEYKSGKAKLYTVAEVRKKILKNHRK
jgi:hypothetical protein